MISRIRHTNQQQLGGWIIAHVICDRSAYTYDSMGIKSLKNRTSRFFAKHSFNKYYYKKNNSLRFVLIKLFFFFISFLTIHRRPSTSVRIELISHSCTTIESIYFSKHNGYSRAIIRVTNGIENLCNALGRNVITSIRFLSTTRVHNDIQYFVVKRSVH